MFAIKDTQKELFTGWFLKLPGEEMRKYYDAYIFVTATDNCAHFSDFHEFLEFMHETETDRAEAEKIYG